MNSFYSDLLSIAGVILSVAGGIGTLYFGVEARRLRNRNIRFDWDDVQLGARKLAQSIFKNFSPEIVFCSSGPSALVANLMLTEIDRYLPVYVGFSQRIDRADLCLTSSYQIEIITTKWKTYLPNEVFLLKDKKVLIIEDCIITGDTIKELLGVFLARGFKRENILVASLIVTDYAINANKGPDTHYYKVTDSSVFYMPWGKGVGKDY